MDNVQSEIKATGESLNKLNQQRSKGYDEYNSNSVSEYTTLVEKYNNVVAHSNKLSEQYNQLKDSYNLLISQISPSRNIAFTTCLNNKVFSL